MALKIIIMSLTIILILGMGSGRDVPNKMKIESEEGGLVDCWNALTEIKSCTNEIILFFLNGKTDIGPLCCRSVAIITHNCWPAMLTSLGFTDQQGYILRGYCDASSTATTTVPIAPSPSPAPA